MKWCEITANTTTEYSDLLADVFFDIGCLGGVKIIDKNDVKEILNTSIYWDYIDKEVLEKDDTVKVSGFVSTEEAFEKSELFKKICTERNYLVGEIVLNEIDDELWYESWKKFYSPIKIGRYLIVPKWLNQTTKDEIKILIDPGMAFGTGEHESTKLCLTLMSEENFSGKDVLDIGTGSGILGLAACLSGAKSCFMSDIDGVAVKAAKENAILNGLTERVQIENIDLLSETDKKGDIVLANLTADILIKLSKDLSNHIRKDGIIICSGIIHERKQDVINAFLKAGFKLKTELSMGEWNALKFVF